MRGRPGCRARTRPSAAPHRGGRRCRRARESWSSDRLATVGSLVDAAPSTTAAERYARTAVLSTIATPGGSPYPASAASSACQMPFSLQRFHRLNSVVRGPYPAGIARQRSPSRYRCRMPLITRRSSTRGLPPRRGRSGSTVDYCASLSQNRSPMIQSLPRTLNQSRRDRHIGRMRAISSAMRPHPRHRPGRTQRHDRGSRWPTGYDDAPGVRGREAPLLVIVHRQANRHHAHPRPSCGFADRRRVVAVVLAALDKRLDILRAGSGARGSRAPARSGSSGAPCPDTLQSRTPYTLQQSIEGFEPRTGAGPDAISVSPPRRCRAP